MWFLNKQTNIYMYVFLNEACFSMHICVVGAGEGTHPICMVINTDGKKPISCLELRVNVAVTPILHIF